MPNQPAICQLKFVSVEKTFSVNFVIENKMIYKDIFVLSNLFSSLKLTSVEMVLAMEPFLTQT